MDMLPLLNVVLIGIFFGSIASYFAIKRGKSPFLWFSMGLMLGIIGLILLFLIPKRKVVEPTPAPAPKLEITPQPPPESEWYFLDARHDQKGPIPLRQLSKYLEEREVTEDSFVWSAGMSKWLQLKEMPHVIEDLKDTSKK